MGVTLRYCDHCGNKMGPDQLESDQVLAIKDKIFCPQCKPKVIAAIEKRKQAAAGQQAAPAAEAAAPPAPKAKAAGPASGRKVPAPRKAPVKGARRAPQPGRAKAEAAKKAAPAAPAAPPPLPPKGDGARPTPKPTPKPKPKGRPAVAQKPGARAASPKSGAKPGAKPGARRPAKAGAGAGVRRKGTAAARRPAPPPEPEEVEVDSGEFEIKKRGNPAVLIGIVVVVAAAVVGGLSLMGGAGGQPEEKPKEPVAKVDPKEALRKENEKSAKKLLDQAKVVFAENPEHYDLAISNFNMIAENYPATEAGKEAGQLVVKLTDEQRTKVAATWQQIETDFKRLTSEEKFTEAYELVKKLPPILEGTVLEEQFEALQEEGKIQGEAMQRFEELKIKAYERLTKGEEDIALHILGEFRDKYQDEAPEVWDIKERTIVRIKKEGTKSFIAEMEKAAKELAEREAAAKEAELAARKKAWADKLQSTRWAKHINPRSDYNWVIDSDRRRFGQDPEWSFRNGVMKANNKTGREMFRAIFANFWQDYALRFDVRLVGGSLKVSPRTQCRAGRFININSQANPMVELTDKDFGRDWVTVTIYVQGDRVQVFKNEMEPVMDKTYDGIQDRLPSSGGFLFWVDDGCNIELRNVETKLVSHTRKGLF